MTVDFRRFREKNQCLTVPFLRHETREVADIEVWSRHTSLAGASCGSRPSLQASCQRRRRVSHDRKPRSLQSDGVGRVFPPLSRSTALGARRDQKSKEVRRRVCLLESVRPEPLCARSSHGLARIAQDRPLSLTLHTKAMERLIETRRVLSLTAWCNT